VSHPGTPGRASLRSFRRSCCRSRLSQWRQTDCGRRQVKHRYLQSPESGLELAHLWDRIIEIEVTDTHELLGYPCTVDCSGHEAGYEWAEQNGVDSAWDCGGDSNSFIEGCQAWAEEQQEEQELDGYDADSEEPDGN
jgi:hypothetical protein